MRSDTPKKPGRFGALRIALAIFVGLLILLIAAGAWLFGTQSGARAAFSALDSLTKGAVQAEGIHGRLGSAVQIDQLRLKTADQRVEIKDLRLDWEATELMQRRLHVQQLRIGQLSVIQQAKKKDEPAQLPANIALPFKLQADKVQIESGRIARGPDDLVKIDGAAFSLAFDGEQYRFGLDRLALRSAEQPESSIANISGHARLSATKPYPVDGRFSTSLETTMQNRTLSASGDIAVDGSLAELATTIDMAFKQAQLNGKAVLQPFSEQPLGSANIAVRDLDLSSINPELPGTELNLKLSATENGAGELELTNQAPGLYNNSRIPLTDLRVAFRREDAGFIFDKISSALGTAKQPAGSVNGSGRYADGALTLALHTPELNLQQLDQRLPPTQLTGKINIGRTEEKQEFTIAFTEPLKKKPLSLAAHGVLADQRLTIDQAELQVGGGAASLSGHVGLSGAQSFAAQGRVSKFRPQDLGNFPQLPSMTLNGKFELSGARSPELTGELAFQITDSRLAGNPLRGEGRAQLRDKQIIVPNLLLVAGANRLTVQGELSERDSELTFALKAPKLGQLGAGFGGAIVASGTVEGTIARPEIDVEWNADGVRLPGKIQIDRTQGSAEIDVDRTKPFFIDAAKVDASARGLKSGTQQLASISAQLRFTPQPNAPFALDIQAKGIAAGEFQADSFNAAVDGTTANHTLDARLTQSKQSWMLKASGGLRDLAQEPEWEGTIDRMNATGRIDANLKSPAPISVSQQRVRLDRFRLDSDAVTIAIEQFVRDSNGIATRGRIERLQLKELMKFTGPSPAVTTDLQLEGEWDVKIADTVDGTVSLRRTGGDVVIRGRVPVALGLGMLQADIAASNGRINLELNARGQKLGQIDVNASTSVAGGAGRFSIPPDAPVSARASIDVPTIAWAGPLMSDTLVTEGRIQSNFSASGTFSEPRLTGRIGGSDLRFYSADLGVDVRNGVLESEFQGSELLVKSLRFQNDDGQLTIAGPISFDDGKPSARLALNADHFMVLNQSDRRLTISGASRIALADGRASVTGDFKVDSGYFDIGREGTPQLSNDVVIVGRTEQEAGRKILPALDIRIGLGDGVKLEGRGIDAVLVGQVHLQSAPGEPLQAYGSLRIAKGTYAAYGRELAIERGVLRFTGPINNPALSIRAMRRGRDLAVEAGVSIQGTVLAPRIELVSEPSVPDAEKLSWLVLGRGLSGVGQGELGSLQDAAGALLSQGAAAGVQSQIANAFGLDTVSLGKSDDNLQQRIITLGKQISSRLYVSYEQGLENANRAITLRYTLTPRLSIEVEAGARSALSLFYNITFD
jgi:translocation and assembly module TamB